MSAEINILLLEDNPDDAELMLRELRRSGLNLQIHRASSEMEYLEFLATPIDIILADYVLPSFSALAALEHLRKRDLRTPLIVVTGMLGDEAAVECIKRGATDYLLKDRLGRLAPAIARAVDERRNAREAELAAERLRHSEEMAAEALRQANATLERHVAERTHALIEANEQLRHEIGERRKTEEQLRQAEKLKAMGQLTGGVAHDFNNLLTSVIGHIDLALQRELDEGTARMLRSAMRSAERGAQLTSQLLAFGRRLPLSVRPVDVRKLVVDLRNMLAITVTPTVTLETAFDPDLWPALADPTQIELALINLTLNARDAMPAGGTLVIEARNHSGGDPELADELAAGVSECVALSVRDTGVGMSAEIMAQVFEPFFTTKAVGKGTGLGLSMVYGLAKQLGGTVRIVSEPNRGTQVTIYIPRAPVAAAVADPLQPSHANPAPPGPVRVLLVDDDVDVREVAAMSLHRAGYHVLEAADGAGALAILEGSTAVDVLVTDLMMPGMSGTCLVSQARQYRPSLPIVLISGHPMALTAQAVDHPVLSKPFRPAELAAAVAECVGAGGTAPKPASLARHVSTPSAGSGMPRLK
jgi:signal transduction histidine kinase